MIFLYVLFLASY